MSPYSSLTAACCPLFSLPLPPHRQPDSLCNYYSDWVFSFQTDWAASSLILGSRSPSLLSAPLAQCALPNTYTTAGAVLPTPSPHAQPANTTLRKSLLGPPQLSPPRIQQRAWPTKYLAVRVLPRHCWVRKIALSLQDCVQKLPESSRPRAGVRVRVGWWWWLEPLV